MAIEVIEVQLSAGATTAGLAAHVDDTTPHPAYDEVDLVAIYENAKV